MRRSTLTAAMQDADSSTGRRPTSRLRARIQIHVDRWRYVPISIACAIIYNVMMIALDRLGVAYALCQAATAVVLVPVGYLLQGSFTFRVERSWRDFIRYSAALITNYPIAIAALWLLRGVLSLDMMWAAPISMLALFVWNYASSAWAFSRRRSYPGDAGGD